MLNDQKTSAVIYKQLFTDAEWDAISSALNDYQDYGDEEANHCRFDSTQDLYNLSSD